MIQTFETSTREAGISRGQQDRRRTDPFGWQQLDATSKLCLVERALHPPAYLIDGYPPAL
jgi:hypothetical protein